MSAFYYFLKIFSLLEFLSLFTFIQLEEKHLARSSYWLMLGTVKISLILCGNT